MLAGAANALRSSSLLAIETESIDDDVRRCLTDSGFRRYSFNPFSRRLQPWSGGDEALKSSNALYIRDVGECDQRLSSAPKRSILGQHI